MSIRNEEYYLNNKPSPRNTYQYCGDGGIENEGLYDDMTLQEFKEDTMIDVIMKRYNQDQPVTHLNRNEPWYGFVPATDFKQAMDIATGATEKFQSLPSQVRKHFDNDPFQFMSSLQDEHIEKTLEELGTVFTEEVQASPEQNEVNQQAEGAVETPAQEPATPE